MRKLNKPKNFRVVYTRCCANCKYFIPDNEEDSYCRRDKDITFDSGRSEEWISVCDGFYYDLKMMIPRRNPTNNTLRGMENEHKRQSILVF